MSEKLSAMQKYYEKEIGEPWANLETRVMAGNPWITAFLEMVKEIEND